MVETIRLKCDASKQMEVLDARTWLPGKGALDCRQDMIRRDWCDVLENMVLRSWLKFETLPRTPSFSEPSLHYGACFPVRVEVPQSARKRLCQAA